MSKRSHIPVPALHITACSSYFRHYWHNLVQCTRTYHNATSCRPAAEARPVTPMPIGIILRSPETCRLLHAVVPDPNPTHPPTSLLLTASPQVSHVTDLVVHQDWQLTCHAEADMTAEWCGLGKAVEVAECKCQAHWLLEVNRYLILLLQDRNSSSNRSDVLY